jgi:flagellar assembly protein FliH
MGKPLQIKSSIPKKASFDEPDLKKPDDPEKKATDIITRAREEAKLIIQEAELEARRLLEQAKTQIEEHIEETEQKAKEEGYKKGECLAQQHYQELLAEAEDLRNRTRTEYEETIRSLEHDIVELAVNIARKVLEAELETSSETILKIARAAIEACLNRDSILLRVSADDYDFVMENSERIKNMAGDIGELEIRKDQTLTKGSCIVDTGYGMVDGGLETKLEMVEQAFREVMGDR